MRRTHAFAAALAAAVLTAATIGGTAIANRGHGDHGRGPGNFTVIEHPDSDQVIDTGAAGDTPGDLLPFANPIYDAANTKQIGTDQGNCIRTQAGVSWECAWTTNLPGGSLVVEGPYLDSGQPTTLAITGGTGRYATARGTMTLSTAGANFSFAFHLRH
jgi:allene oxide cyclase